MLWSRQELIGTYIIDIERMFFAMPMAFFPALAAKFGENSVGLFYSATRFGAFDCEFDIRLDKKCSSSRLFVLFAAGLCGVWRLYFSDFLTDFGFR